MYLIIGLVLILLLFFHTPNTIKEGATGALNTVSVLVDPSKNSITLPNNIKGAQGEHVNFLGDVSLKNPLHFVKEYGNNVDAGSIQYDNGTLKIMGAGTDPTTSLWGKVNVGSLLQANGGLSVQGDTNLGNDARLNYGDMLEIRGNTGGSIEMKNNVAITGAQSVSGHQTVGTQEVGGLQTVNSQIVTTTQTVKGTQTVEGASTHKGKINIDSNETINLSLGNSGIGKGKDGLRFYGTDPKPVGGFHPDGAYVKNSIKFGPEFNGQGGKIETNPTSLEVEGVGSSKKIKLSDNVEVVGDLTVIGDVTTKGKKVDSDVIPTIRSGFTRKNGSYTGHSGRIEFKPAFDSSITPDKIHIVCTPESFSKDRNPDWYYSISVHVVADTVSHTGFNYNMSIRPNGQSFSWGEGWGEGFHWIAHVS